jgi:hypothetical protein
MASLMSDITETDGYRSKDDDDDGDEKKAIDESDNVDRYKNDKSSSQWKSTFVTQDPKDRTVLQDAVKLLHTNDPTSPLQLNGYTVVPSTSSDLLEVPSSQQQRRVMMRKASINVYQGEGVEVTDVLSADDSELYMPAMADSLTMKNSNSFDDLALQINSNRVSSSGKDIFRRIIRRSYSEDSTGLFRGKPLTNPGTHPRVTTMILMTTRTRTIMIAGRSWKMNMRMDMEVAGHCPSASWVPRRKTLMHNLMYCHPHCWKAYKHLSPSKKAPTTFG